MTKVTQQALNRDIAKCNKEVLNARKKRDFLLKKAKLSTSFSLFCGGLILAGSLIASSVVVPLTIVGGSLMLLSGGVYLTKATKAQKKWDEFRHEKTLENNFRYDLKTKRKRVISEIEIYKISRREFHLYPSPKYEKSFEHSRNVAIHHINEYRRARDYYLQQEKQRG